jgi:5-methylcytosine-specific restriction protein A
MSTLLSSVCRELRCPRIATRAGRCAGHNREYEQRRGSAAARGYGSKWQKLRKLILARDPICTTTGCNEPSTQVDHIVSRRRGGTDHPGNLHGLCQSHHSSKTAREDSGWG